MDTLRICLFVGLSTQCMTGRAASSLSKECWKRHDGVDDLMHGGGAVLEPPHATFYEYVQRLQRYIVDLCLSFRTPTYCCSVRGPVWFVLGEF